MNQVNQVVNKHELIYMQEVVQDVYVEESIYEYITLLVELTRRNPLVNLGVSPRGSLALMNMAKSTAFLFGRDYVVPSDVQGIFKDVVAHRMILKAKARVNNITVDKLLDDILNTIAPPRII